MLCYFVIMENDYFLFSLRIVHEVVLCLHFVLVGGAHFDRRSHKRNRRVCAANRKVRML
jgi:hypothetical protein